MKTEREIIDHAAAVLSEHFDAVQIVVSKIQPNGSTRCLKSGTGNWYARQAMCSEFVREDAAELGATTLAEKLNPPDSGDSWKSSKL